MDSAQGVFVCKRQKLGTKDTLLYPTFPCVWLIQGFTVFFYFIIVALSQDVRKTDPAKNETVVGEHLKFERKDVWDMKWADVS